MTNRSHHRTHLSLPRLVLSGALAILATACGGVDDSSLQEAQRACFEGSVGACQTVLQAACHEGDATACAEMDVPAVSQSTRGAVQGGCPRRRCFLSGWTAPGNGI